MQSRSSLVVLALLLAACTSPIDLDHTHFYCNGDDYCLPGWRCDTEHNVCVREGDLPDADVVDAGSDAPIELPDLNDLGEATDVEGVDVPADEASPELPGCVDSACDDGNPCTTDFCNDQDQCDHTPASGGCSDGDACTVNDHCEDSACKGARLNEELYCDGQDEDCDGLTDEICPCFDGDGDTYPSTDDCGGLPRDCDDGNAAIRPAGDEACGNGVDDDCDGADRFCGPRGGMNLAGTGAYLIDAYEASTCPSNPAAACSLPQVFPWRDLSWEDARKACKAGGKHLCSRDEWQLACGGSQELKFPYGDEYDETVCNTLSANGIAETGSFTGCLNDESGAFDMVGNVAEWVGSSTDDTLVIGGEVYLGKVATCTYAVQPDNPTRPWIGFRCCLAWDDDNDADGAIASVDCDDGDPASYPGKTEVCNGKDDDCDGSTDEGFDQDGDDWPSCFDCDDTRPAIHPGQPEACNGVDDDCNGKTDDGFPDLDNDKHGAGCGDCDDADPKIYAGATEVCDGRDNDCDGNADEGFSTVDKDSDGWNDCGDCDDTIATTHPGAAESCNCVDDDCDGETDEAFDLDHDGYGGGPECAPACADCDDADDGSFPGAPEPCDSRDNDCDGTTDEGFSLLHQACDGPDSDKCKRGEFVCNAAKNGVVCGPEAVENLQELCNAEDDDCNGLTDETFTLLGKACDNDDDDSCAEGAWVCDEDGQGVLCDEAPGAGHVETCNGDDDDCDGATDEGFDDLDLDGQADCVDPDDDGDGDPDGSDCQPADPQVFTGALEACADGVDNDCDGLTDCRDAACDGLVGCLEVDCANGVDDENDGRADCADPDCAGQACSDQTACTTDDTCVPDPGGADGTQACVGAPVTCTDPDPCTDDVCDALLGCTFPAKTCDDGDPLTVDTCEPVTGDCLHN